MTKDASFDSLVAVAVAVLLLSIGAAPAAAGFNALLNGDYAFSGSSTCLVSRGGFNTDFTPVGPPAPFPFVFSFSVQGIRTFNGDGTGSLVARVVNTNHPFALPTTPAPVFNRGSATSTDVEGTFTYAVAPDRTLTIQTVTLTGTVLTGPSAGQTLTVTDLPVFFGGLSKDGKTLTIAHTEPGVETVTFFNGNIQTDKQQRICHRARILLAR